MRKLILAILATVVSATGASAQTTCSFDKAVYRPVDEAKLGRMANYRLTHARKNVGPNQSNLVMTISADPAEAGGQPQSHDFSFAFSNGYSRAYVNLVNRHKKSLSKEEDRPSSAITYFDKDMRKVEPHGEPVGEAPAFLIMPEISVRFWYAGKPFDRSFMPSDGLWKFSECAG